MIIYLSNSNLQLEPYSLLKYLTRSESTHLSLLLTKLLLNALKKSKSVFKDGISPDKLADIGEAHPGAIMALNGEEMPDS